MTQVKAEISIHAPAEKVWFAMTHHEGMIDWPRVDSVNILKKGTNHPDGLGCIREVSSDRMYVKEEITKYEPPFQMDFQVLESNIPIIHHGGQIIFTSDTPNTTSVIWKSEIDINIQNPLKRLFAPWIIKYMGEKGLRNALNWVKQNLEKSNR